MPFEAYSPTLNVGIFAAAAAAVWAAGTRLSRYADVIATRTGAGHAFVGAMLLGGVTSLPEIATVVTAARLGNAPLAVNNMLGGIAMQVAILGAADSMVRRHPMSRLVADPAVLLQGVLLVLALSVVLLGVVHGDRLVLGVGAWTWLVLFCSLGGFFLMHRHGGRQTWEADGMPGAASTRSPKRDGDGPATAHLAVKSIAAAIVILIAGFVLARAGDVLAHQTGLGSNFLGVALLATATSLPELSTTLSAMRLGAVTMAYSNIFGANILDTSILFLADAVYPGGPVLAEVGTFTTTAGLLGILLTAVALVGLLVRPTRQLLRLGPDSWLLLVGYAAGLWLLYTIR